MRKVITVGAGDYYTNNLMPAFKKLKGQGLIEHIAVVDIKANEDFVGIEHIIRRGETLSSLLGKYREDDPLVILAHSNHMHVPDAINLSSAGFDVAIEKPFALSIESLKTFLQSAKKENYFLLEYYLMMKAAPLLFGFGKIAAGSFYCEENLLEKETCFDKYASSLDDFSGRLPDLVGDIKSVEVDILEGEGLTGSLEHRGPSLIDIRAGGGMIQDLGVHALAPIYAIGPSLGGLVSAPILESIKIAISNEYANMAEQRFGLKKGHIAESYAQFVIESRTGIPVSVRVGKYIMSGSNQRGITIKGSKRDVFMDLNTCVLYIGSDPVLKILKDKEKYYPVIRAAIDFFDKKPLYNFDQNKTASKSQETVLLVQDEAYRNLTPTYYNSTLKPKEVFPS